MLIKYARIALLGLCLLICTQVLSQNLEAVKGKTSYHFWLHTPESKENKQPVFVFLHGRSLCGSNIERVKRYGMLYAMQRGHKVPGFVIAPQTQGAWNAHKVMEVVDYVLQNNPSADASRVYVCGMSLGGYGTMEVVGKYPDRIAAAVGLCGGGATSDASNWAKVPIRLYHGTADRAVPISESRKIYKAVKAVNSDADIELFEMKGASHGRPERLFHQSEIYDWMLQYSKEQELR